jgi:hypothetical protein
LAVVVATAAAGSSYWYLEAQTIANRCGSEQLASDQLAATSGYSHKWNWWPFAYVCVYRDDRGKEAARRFPERPHPGDLG